MKLQDGVDRFWKKLQKIRMISVNKSKLSDETKRKQMKFLIP